MRIVNLANCMDIFRRKPVGCGFLRTPWSAYNGGNIAPVWLKSKKNLRVTSPHGLEASLYAGVRSASEDRDGAVCRVVAGSDVAIVLFFNSGKQKLAFFLFFNSRVDDFVCASPGALDI
jgi:hypothetical protein